MNILRFERQLRVDLLDNGQNRLYFKDILYSNDGVMQESEEDYFDCDDYELKLLKTMLYEQFEALKRYVELHPDLYLKGSE